MKVFIKAIILTLVLTCFTFAQYDAEVSSYNIYWNKLSSGEPIVTDTFHSDTVITMLWERGDGTEVPYVSPYTGTIVIAMVVVNSPTIWTDNTAAVARDIVLDNGIYEVTVTESDIYNNESGPSNPMFIQVAKSVARIQINVRLR